MIEVRHLSKKYGKAVANDDICLEVRSGQITILLGPNGAGKSTLIKSVCGLLRFQGTVTIDGHDNHSVEAKRLLGYVPEFPSLYQMLTVDEHLEFIARAYGLKDRAASSAGSGSHWEARAEDLLARFELADKRAKLGKELPKGMQQKLSVCCALLPEPRAVIMDEPLVGLDPHGIRELKATIADLRASGCAVLLSTHMIESVEDNWDTTYIMKAGRVAAVCERDGMTDQPSLEQTYFAIIDGDQE